MINSEQIKEILAKIAQKFTAKKTMINSEQIKEILTKIAQRTEHQNERETLNQILAMEEKSNFHTLNQIYEQVVDYILIQSSQNNNSNLQTKKKLLSVIAYNFSCQDKKEFSQEELRKEITNYAQKKPGINTNDIMKEIIEGKGIIEKINATEDKYRFFHFTCEEYLTAFYFYNVIKENETKGMALIKEHLEQRNWYEKISLVAGLMPDPVPLLQMITQKKDDIFTPLLLLAGLCISECAKNDHPLIRETVEKICQSWQNDPDGIFGFEPIIIALAKNGNEQTIAYVINALKHSNYEIKNNAYFALIQIGNDQMINGLIDHLESSDYLVKSQVLYALEALGKMGDVSVIRGIIKAVYDSDNLIKTQAVQSLGNIGNDQAIASLMKIYDQCDFSIKCQLIEALVKIGNDQSVEYLIKLLNDADTESFIIIEELEKIGNEPAIKGLIKAINHPDYWIKTMALKALLKIGNEQAMADIINNWNNFEYAEFLILTEISAEIGNDKAVEILIKIMENYDDSLIIDAIKAIITIANKNQQVVNNNAQLIKSLIKAKKNYNYRVRSAAFQALRKIENKIFIEKLNEFDNYDYDDELNNATEIAENIFKNRESGGDEVRSYKPEALEKINKAEILAKLIEKPNLSDRTNIFILGKKLLFHNNSPLNESEKIKNIWTEKNDS